jgi:hypothetical protein
MRQLDSARSNVSEFAASKSDHLRSGHVHRCVALALNGRAGGSDYGVRQVHGDRIKGVGGCIPAGADYRPLLSLAT